MVVDVIQLDFIELRNLKYLKVFIITYPQKVIKNQLSI